MRGSAEHAEQQIRLDAGAALKVDAADHPDAAALNTGWFGLTCFASISSGIGKCGNHVRFNRVPIRITYTQDNNFSMHSSTDKR